MSTTPNEENNIVTFNEIVEYETRNLAGCDNDDTCCTFPKGYVNRQALYLCVTCLKATGKQAGICYPCSVHCHNDHQLLDLFTKRNFRCDCGNANFPSDFKCKLWEDKDDINKLNGYNHNFSGLFCACASEYKETEENEDMYQCNICEDWYHLKHLSDNIEELTVHRSIIDESLEFTCRGCLINHDCLRIYNDGFINNITAMCVPGSCGLVATKEMLVAQRAVALKALECGAFWPEDWRQSLCSCAACKVMMAETDLKFLVNERDSMGHYYHQVEANEHSDDLKEALAELPYTQAIAIAEGIANYKRQLSEFISSQDPDKVVTSDDVNNFFDDLKRRRLDGQE